MNQKQALERIFNKQGVVASNSPDETETDIQPQAQAEENDPYAKVDPVHTETERSSDPRVRTIFWTSAIGLFVLIGGYVVTNPNFSLSRAKTEKRNTPEQQQNTSNVIESDKVAIDTAFSHQDVAQERAESVNMARQMEDQMLNGRNNPENAAQAQPTGTTHTPRPATTVNTVTLPRTRTAYRVPRSPARNTPPPPITQPKPPKRDVTPSRVRTTKPQVIQQAAVQEVDAAGLYASIDNIGTYGGMSYDGNQQGQAFTNSGFEQQGQILMGPGESLQATLQTSIFWGGDKASKSALAVVTQGTETLPAGTTLVLAMTEAGNSQLVDLTVSHIVQDGAAIAVNGQTNITDHKGNPLKASKKGSGSKLLPIIGRTLLGAAKVGSGIINRPNSVVSTTSNFTSSISQSGDNDILAALVEGGSDALLTDLEQRNQAALQTNKDQEFYLLQKGKSITITAIQQLQG